MPQAKAHNVSETGSVSLFPVKGSDSGGGGHPPLMCPLQRSMHFATDPAGQILLLSVFLLEKGDISSLLYIVLFFFYLR